MASLSKVSVIVPLLILIALAIGCKNLGSKKNNSSAPADNASSENAGPTPATVEANDDGTIPSGTGVEKEKPAAGKGNVQGKALFNGQPAVGVEVKLCEKFNSFMGGCTGKSYTTKTDENGEYLIKDVAPAIYDALTVRVFNANYYVFATSGIIAAAKYKIEPDKTFFAPVTNLFKNDLKVTDPKMNAKVAGSGIVVKWNAYPDAAYYKVSVYADSQSGAEVNLDYVNKRVDATEFKLDTPLKPGKYWVKVEAFNSNDTKLSETNENVDFTVTG